MAESALAIDPASDSARVILSAIHARRDLHLSQRAAYYDSVSGDGESIEPLEVDAAPALVEARKRALKKWAHAAIRRSLGSGTPSDDVAALREKASGDVAAVAALSAESQALAVLLADTVGSRAASSSYFETTWWLTEALCLGLLNEPTLHDPVDAPARCIRLALGCPARRHSGLRARA